MRIKHKVNVRIANDADMYDLLIGPDDTRSEVTIDAYTRMTSCKLKVTATENEDVPLGDVDACKGIYLIVDQEVILKLNGGTEEFQVRKPTTSASVYARFFFEGDINQVNITAGSDDALATFCVWGDTT